MVFTRPTLFFLVAIGASALLVLVGLVIPAFTFDTIVSFEKEVSILGGAVAAIRSEDRLIGVVVILFSAVFPTAKLIGLARLVVQGDESAGGIMWLELLGKWSMLDVFVVTTLIGAARLRFISDVHANKGVFVFAAGILLSLVITTILAERRRRHRLLVRHERPARWQALGLSALSLGLFIAAMCLPVLEIDKWILDKRFSLLTSPVDMIGQGEYLLPAVIYVFVVCLPLVRIFLLLLFHAQPDPSQVLTGLVYRVGRWAMLDVYVLALVIVMTKLGTYAEFRILPGFWLLLAAASTSTIAGFFFQQAVSVDTTATSTSVPTG